MTTYADTKQIARHAADDWSVTFDGNYIGSFKTRWEAEQALNDHALSLIEQGLVDLPLTLLDTPVSQYPCLGCGGALPAGRGGHCDACVEWDSDDTPDADDCPDHGPYADDGCPKCHHTDPDEQPEPWPDAPIACVNWNS